MKRVRADKAEFGTPQAGGLIGWMLTRVLGQLIGRVRGMERPGPRLALLERISLAPRHSLALVEAEGRRFLVATSADGAPAFYAFDDPVRLGAVRRGGPIRPTASRVSW
jgi:flagellar biogenesis protein FliO